MDAYDYDALTNEVVNRNINMFHSFEDWTKGAFALSNLGEEGRRLFKQISRLSDKYNERENDIKSSNALRTNSRVNISSFIYMCRQHNIDTNRFFVKDDAVDKFQLKSTAFNHNEEKRIVLSIDKRYVEERFDVKCESDLARFLMAKFPNVDSVVETVNKYRIGISHEGHTIFWYIDRDDDVRMGKIMAYREGGHRDHSLFPRSVPRELVKQGLLSDNYTLKQTLFGEHLLSHPENNDKIIGIVESEKTAVICSLCLPDIIWLATGSMNNLQTERMEAVRTRNVIFFPDTDEQSMAYNKWCSRAEELNRQGWHIQVSDYLENVATQEQRQQKIDIADLLIANIEDKKQQREESMR